MNRSIFRFFAVAAQLLLLLVWGLEPALANKFETIGGGVSGLSRDKLDLLKQISLYTGSFFVFLGVVALLTRKRFEGFIGYSAGANSEIAIKGAAFMTILGTLLILIGYL